MSDLLEKYVTKEGKQIIEVHMKSLGKCLVKFDTYPQEVIGFFGFKKTKTSVKINSSEELVGRIKMCMTILGVEEIDILRYGKITLNKEKK